MDYKPKKASRLVNVAYVEYGDGLRRTSLRETLSVVQLAGLDISQLVVVDNKGQCAPLMSARARRTIVMAGTNDAREFGAWDEAFASMQVDDDTNAWLFVNDTFVAHRRARYLRRFRFAKWLKNVSMSPAPELFGQVDPFNWIAETPFGLTESFLCSYVFGMNTAAVKKMFPLTQIDSEIDKFLQLSYSRRGLFQESLHPSYRENLEAWLHTSGNWRNAQALNEKNFSFMRLKAKSILYEHALIPRARALGIHVYDLFDGKSNVDRLVGSFAKTWLAGTALHRHWRAAFRR